MSNQVTLPEVGDNVEQGTVVTVLVKAGDTVSEGQAVIEIETDKAVVEVPANASGVVESVQVKEGDTVKVGGVILTLAGGAAPAAAAPEAEAPAPAASAAAAQAQQASQEQQAAPAQAVAQAAPAAQAPSAAQTVTLPEVGDNVEQGTVVTVLVKAGDTVSEGQAVIEIETDKAVVEVPANASGVVESVQVKEGDTVKVGGVILTLADGAAPAAPAAPATEAPAAPAAAPAVTGGEQPAGQNPQAQAQGTQNPQTYNPAAQAAQTFDGRPVIHAAPSVRRLARELGINLAGVQGSGPAGRISEGDVRGLQGGTQPVPQAPQAQAPAAQAPTAPAVQAAAAQLAPVQAAPVQQAAQKLPDFEKWGRVRREDMNGIRKATVRSMTNAWSSVPMVTHFDKADVTRMEETRKAFAARVEKAGGKLTMTAILLKVVANVVRRNPKFGASLDLENQQVIYKDYVNLGVAVDTPNGLLVPVLKDADRKSITEIVLELNELAAKARDRKLKPDEMSGATFTISNLGGIGGYAFTPIVNPPEVAILGVSRGGFEPVWNRETSTFEPRNMLPLSLSYDHRLIDGADAARFVRQICEMLEDPFLISL
ncbi:dihydrolipoyllysine-residue acetyltransferase [Deinococcus aquiradiocola]|uniref:Acetyltransferase component of pyruvate dehydrogenase complex n=1 Tax=Deinococcus aquiradiocola TaxID=393059 RepID=A0A917PPX0_9DEIO|nr:dihydrolipoyllysine-residue acetyltransferase [Deinococcus aquiradiocola]GGJ87717.1 acetyltransferase component of pyruvate dehydrogenase complex [Deinococcus aquiradiocola]